MQAKHPNQVCQPQVGQPLVGQPWYSRWLANHNLANHGVVDGWPTTAWPTTDYDMIGQPIGWPTYWLANLQVGQPMVGRALVFCWLANQTKILPPKVNTYSHTNICKVRLPVWPFYGKFHDHFQGFDHHSSLWLVVVSTLLNVTLG